MTAIYNENDAYAAQWLENLITAGHIAPGKVDRRSITDLTPADVAGPGQRHFFAGIGGWPYALRLAGISDDASVWTGSCPCQPFADGGKRLGVLDSRHLWPTWFDLIKECRPSVVFGEQTASKDGIAWLELVSSDLEGCGYAVGSADLCAASINAIHIRQRLWWVAYAEGVGRSSHDLLVSRAERTTPVATRGLHRVDVAGRWWWSPAIGEREPTLVRNHDGLPGQLAGLGNAIVPPLAAAFIQAALEAQESLG